MSEENNVVSIATGETIEAEGVKVEEVAAEAAIAAPKQFHFGVSVSTLFNCTVTADSVDEAVRYFDDWLRGSGAGMMVEVVKKDMNVLGVGVFEAGKMASAGQISEALAVELDTRPELNVDVDKLFVPTAQNAPSTEVV